MTDDPINHPKHYQLPNGLEVIQITEHCDFLTGNIIKYLLRAGNKDGNTRLQDLQKAEWYLRRAIKNEVGPELIAGRSFTEKPHPLMEELNRLKRETNEQAQTSGSLDQ